MRMISAGLKSAKRAIAILFIVSFLLTAIYYLNIKDITEITAQSHHNQMHMGLTIMTFNVFGFYNDNKNGNKSIRSLIIDSEADIVLIQEDKFLKPKTFNGIVVDEYERVVECKTNPNKRNSIGNSILVSKRYLNKNQIFETKSIDVTVGCPTPRCAVFVLFDNGLSIVNTHFCGGKYDDRNFAKTKMAHVRNSIVYAKNNALHKMWNHFGNFTFIGGDFNGMNNKSLNALLFQSYPLFKSMHKYNQEQFSTFFQTPHILLTQNGYKSAYTEQIAIKTAQIGPQINVPDWIYINSQIKYVVQKVETFDAISKPYDVSDHNPVIVTFDLNLDITHSKWEESIEILNGYYVLHTADDFDCVTVTAQTIIHDTCTGLNNQLFFIKFDRQVSNHKYYTIQSNDTKLYWTIISTKESLKLYQREYSGYRNQMFDFIHYNNSNNASGDRYRIRVHATQFISLSSESELIIQPLHREKNTQLFVFTVFEYLSEPRTQFTDAITVQECVDNVPLIQTFIKHNTIQPLQSKYFPNTTKQATANVSTDGYSEIAPIDAVKFFIGHSHNESYESRIAYHGVINPESYVNILLKNEGLKGFVNYIGWMNISHLGPVVFLTPSYILASHHYGTFYVFHDYAYSLVLEVRVDITKRIKAISNTICKNIDPNIPDDEIEWIYKDENVQISGLIVKKFAKHSIAHSRFRKSKLDKEKDLIGYV